MKRLLPLLLMALASCAPLSWEPQTTPDGPSPAWIVGMELDQVVPDVKASFEIPGDTHAWVRLRMERWFEGRGFLVAYPPLLGSTRGLMGLTDSLSFVLVDGAMSVNSQAATLLHEAAHHFTCKDWKYEVQREVCAETSAYLTAKSVGFDTRHASYAYMALVPKVWRDPVLVSTETRIRDTVKTLREVLK